MILKEFQMSQLHSYQGEGNGFWFNTWVVSIFVWIASTCFNLWLYTTPYFDLFPLAIKIFSGSLILSLIGFIGLICVESDITPYCNHSDYEDLPRDVKKSLFLYSAYYIMFVIFTPLVFIALPIVIIKCVVHDIPCKLLDIAFKEPEDKSNVLSDYNKLLKKSRR